MTGSHRRWTLSLAVWAAFFVLSFRVSTSFAQQPQYSVAGPIADTGGQVYSVKAYGAKGNGSADDTSALRAAEVECEAGAGGTVELPPGKYLISGSITVASPNCGWHGEGVPATALVASSALTPMLKLYDLTATGGTNTFTNHDAQFSGFRINCNNSDPAAGTGRQGIGIELVDSQFQKLDNIAINNCATAIELNAVTFFLERNVFSRITGTNNTQMFLFNQTAGDSHNSFGYNRFENIEFNTYASGDAVWRFTGQPSVYNDSFQVMGNMQGGSYIFDLSGGTAMQGPTIDIKAESNGGTNYAFYSGSVGNSNNSCGNPSACIVGAVPMVLDVGSISLQGGSSWYDFDTGGRNLNNGVYLGTVSGTVSLDLQNYGFFSMTLGGNTTIATKQAIPQNGKWTIVIVQNASTAYTVTWPGNFAGAGTVSSTLGSRNVQNFSPAPDGTSAYAISPMVVY